MKNILFFIGLFFSTMLCAQNNMLTEIEKANVAYKSIEGTFTRTQINAAKGTAETDKGSLFLADENQMAQHYAAPSTDVLIINGDDFYMVRGKRKNKFNTAKNKTMRGLKNTLLYCVHGKPVALAEENGAEITAEKTSKGYNVVLVSTKKTPRGYAKIALTYDLKTKLLTKMQMDEYNGNSTVYEMSGLKTNTSIDVKVFEIPEK